MPHEHDMPAPVTTTIFLHLATASERFARDLLACASEVDASRSRVIVIAREDGDDATGDRARPTPMKAMGGEKGESGRLTRKWLLELKLNVRPAAVRS